MWRFKANRSALRSCARDIAWAAGNAISDTAPAASTRTEAREVSRSVESDHRRERHEQVGGGKEPGKNQRRFESDALPDVAVHVVCELVGEHDLDFILRVLLEHRVRHENATERPMPVNAAFASWFSTESPLVGVQHVGAGALGERDEPGSKRLRVSGFTE